MIPFTVEVMRRKAEAESASGVRNSALLDATHQSWRDELPIYVPAKDEALVAELLTGLLDERMTGLSKGWKRGAIWPKGTGNGFRQCNCWPMARVPDGRRVAMLDYHGLFSISRGPQTDRCGSPRRWTMDRRAGAGTA